MDISQNIKRVAKIHGLSLKDLAIKLNVTRESLSITIHKEGIQLNTIERIANAIGCNVIDLLQPADKPITDIYDDTLRYITEHKTNIQELQKAINYEKDIMQALKEKTLPSYLFGDIFQALGMTIFNPNESTTHENVFRCPHCGKYIKISAE